MDKLEKALQKARAQRDMELNQPAAPQGRAAGSHGAPLSFANSNIANSNIVTGEFPVANRVQIDEAWLDRYHIVAHRTRNKEADVFRILRTQILQIMGKSGFKTIGITSPNYGDGKTTVALNLAVSIALDLKQTVLLADLDLRKPNIVDYLGIRASSGITDYFSHDVPIAQCILRTSFERMTILPAGHALDHSSEVLGSPKITELAYELKTRYADRLIIYDMPPILAQDDPIAFLPNVDAVLMVVNEGVTWAADIKKSMHRLAEANVIGTVLNNANRKP